MHGGQSPRANKERGAYRSTGVTGPSGESASLEAQSAMGSKAHAELLQEVYRVVFLKEPKDRAEFGSFVDSLNQGASFEGIYNGFTHSSDYRKLEIAQSGASPEALKAFGEELAFLEVELPSPTIFSAADAQPLSFPVQPGVDPNENVGSPAAMPSAVASTAPRADIKKLTESYTQLFVGASIFTLKRILGDEALKVMTLKKEYPEKMAHWYSQWVVRIAARNVDFGISLRNQANEELHYHWALQATEDRIKWEVLNRLHRVLNEANRPKQ